MIACRKNRFVLYGVLCAVLAALIVLCTWFLFRLHVYRLEEAAIEGLLARGVDVDVVPASTFLGVPLCDREVNVTFHRNDTRVAPVSLHHVRNLGGIEFVDCVVSGEALTQVRCAERLRLLVVRRGTIDETVWAELPKLTGIQWVFLIDVPVKGTNLRDLGRLMQMTTLYLVNNGVSDDSLRNLQPAPMLEDLHISGNPVKGNGLRWLSGLAHLEMLELVRCQLRAEEVGAIKSVGSLGSLRLVDESCNADVLRALSSVQNITSLSLSGLNVTDETVMPLYGMKQLRYVSLSGTKVTRKGLDTIKKNLPLARVEDTSLGN